jgi:hypothetical protein
MIPVGIRSNEESTACEAKGGLAKIRLDRSRLLRFELAYIQVYHSYRSRGY